MQTSSSYYADQTVGRLEGIKDPVSAARYYHAVVNNPRTHRDTQDAVIRFRKEHPEHFASDDEVMARGGYRSVMDRFYSDYRDQSRRQSRYYDDGEGISVRGNPGYQGDVYGSPGWDRYGNMRGYGGGYRRGYDGGYRRQDFQRTPISVARSEEQIAAKMDKLSSPIRRSQYFDAVVNNPESNPDTVARLKAFRKANPSMFATDKQISSFKQRASRPFSETRSMGDIEKTMGTIRSKTGRTNYFLAAINNPETPKGTRENLVKFRNAHPELFADDEYAIRRKQQREARGLGYMPAEEFSAMSKREQHYYLSSRERGNRAQNTGYALKIITNPYSEPEDRMAMARVVRKNPLMFFRTPFSKRGEE